MTNVDNQKCYLLMRTFRGRQYGKTTDRVFVTRQLTTSSVMSVYERVTPDGAPIDSDDWKHPTATTEECLELFEGYNDDYDYCFLRIKTRSVGVSHLSIADRAMLDEILGHSSAAQAHLNKGGVLTPGGIRGTAGWGFNTDEYIDEEDDDIGKAEERGAN